MSINLDKLEVLMKQRSLVKLVKSLNLLKTDMEVAWKDLMPANTEVSPIITDHVGEVKARLIQSYIVIILGKIRLYDGVDLLHLTSEHLEKEGYDNTWRVDSIILSLSSNKISSHEDLYKLALVNILAVNSNIANLVINPSLEAFKNAVGIDNVQVDLSHLSEDTDAPESLFKLLEDTYDVEVTNYINKNI